MSARPEGSQRGAQVGERAHRDPSEIGLGDDEHVGDLHDPGLEELEHVAGARLDDDRDRVRDIGDLGLRLTDADSLDDDDVERGGERGGGGPGRGGEAAEPVAGGRRADEHLLVGRVDVDPRAIAEQRAARASRGRIDREHRDRPSARPPFRDEPGEQRGLADAGRAR